MSHQPIDFSMENILAAAREVLPEVLKALGERANGRTGGFLRGFCASSESAADGPKGWRQVGNGVMVGHLLGSNPDWEKYRLISFEKAVRLMAHHARDGHVSSWQSRDLTLARYGGAILGQSFSPKRDFFLKKILSFSGLPEEGDEALDLLVAQRLNVEPSIDEILAASNNHVARQVLGLAA